MSRPDDGNVTSTTTTMSAIKRIAVIGAGGQMGLGIAYVASLRAKLPTYIYDNSQAQLSKSLTFYDKLLARDVEKGRLTQDVATAARERIMPISSIDSLGDSSSAVDLVIEAIPEIPSIKLPLMAQLSSLLPPPAIIASNTSSISLTRLAKACIPKGVDAASEKGKALAARVVGIHFFNPVPQMKLVELIPALQTSPETIERARAFAVACGKEVTTSRDEPGFVANAILMPMINEAIMTLEKGVATAQDIDTTFKLGMGHPMGPLQLADFIGLDTCLAIQRVLHTETGDSKYRPSGLLVKMVEAGWVGKKGGKGFYEY